MPSICPSGRFGCSVCDSRAGPSIFGVGQFGDVRRPGRSAPGQRRVLHEEAVTVEGERAFGRFGAGKTAIGGHYPALRDVGHVGGHYLTDDLCLDGRVLDFDQRFDAAIQVAAHPVGGTDIDPRLFRGQVGPVAETDDARMLKEPPDDGFDADIVAEPLDAGAQPADAPDHEADFHARLAGGIERVGHR